MALPLTPYVARPVQDYAKSCLEVADYEMRVPDGDLNLAREYLELVAGSNAEDVGRAAEMLKLVKSMIHNRAAILPINRAETSFS